MKFFQKRSFFSFMIALGVGANLFCGAVLTARAEVIDYQALAEANLSIPVESNEIKNWPEGPILNARSAILMDADSGAILYPDTRPRRGTGAAPRGRTRRRGVSTPSCGSGRGAAAPASRGNAGRTCGTPGNTHGNSSGKEA